MALTWLLFAVSGGASICAADGVFRLAKPRRPAVVNADIQWPSDTIEVPGWGADVVAIVNGLTDRSVLALKTDGTVVTTDGTTLPSGLSNVVAVAAGETEYGFASFDLALLADGTVTAWGDGTYGQTAVPAGLSNVVAIAAGAYHSLALRADGTVVTWGWNNAKYGEYVAETDVPVDLGHVVAISAGNTENLALRDDGSVVAWRFPYNNDAPPLPTGVSNVIGLAADVWGNDSAWCSDGSGIMWTRSKMHAGIQDVPFCAHTRTW